MTIATPSAKASETSNVSTTLSPGTADYPENSSKPLTGSHNNNEREAESNQLDGASPKSPPSSQLATPANPMQINERGSSLSGVFVHPSPPRSLLRPSAASNTGHPGEVLRAAYSANDHGAKTERLSTDAIDSVPSKRELEESSVPDDVTPVKRPRTNASDVRCEVGDSSSFSSGTVDTSEQTVDMNQTRNWTSEDVSSEQDKLPVFATGIEPESADASTAHVLNIQPFDADAPSTDAPSTDALSFQSYGSPANTTVTKSIAGYSLSKDQDTPQDELALTETPEESLVENASGNKSGNMASPTKASDVRIAEARDEKDVVDNGAHPFGSSEGLVASQLHLHLRPIASNDDSLEELQARPDNTSAAKNSDTSQAEPPETVKQPSAFCSSLSTQNISVQNSSTATSDQSSQGKEVDISLLSDVDCGLDDKGSKATVDVRSESSMFASRSAIDEPGKECATRNLLDSTDQENEMVSKQADNGTTLESKTGNESLTEFGQYHVSLGDPVASAADMGFSDCRSAIPYGGEAELERPRQAYEPRSSPSVILAGWNDKPIECLPENQRTCSMELSQERTSAKAESDRNGKDKTINTVESLKMDSEHRADNHSESGVSCIDQSADHPAESNVRLNEKGESDVSSFTEADEESSEKAPLTLSENQNMQGSVFRSAPLDRSDETLAGEDQGCEPGDQSSFDVPKKRVRWMPDEQLVEVRFIDTRIQLIKNWDPDYEITLPFAPSTLAQLRAQGAIEVDEEETARKPAVSAGQSSLKIRSAPAPDDFESARRKEREMELERSRQAKVELQTCLNMMMPETEWQTPLIVILPSECRVSTSEYNDADDGEVQENSSTFPDSPTAGALQIPWLKEKDDGPADCVPSSPQREFVAEMKNSTLKIPSQDVASEGSSFSNSDGGIFAEPVHASFEDSNPVLPEQDLKTSQRAGSRPGMSLSKGLSNRPNPDMTDNWDSRSQNDGSAKRLTVKDGHLRRPSFSGDSIIPPSNQALYPTTSPTIPVAAIPHGGVSVDEDSMFRSVSSELSSSPQIAPSTPLGIAHTHHGMAALPPLALQQLLAQFQENAVNMAMPSAYQLPGAMMPSLPVSGMTLPQSQLLGMHSTRPMNMHQAQRPHPHNSSHSLRGKSHSHSQSTSDVPHRGRGRKLCRYFNTPQGCRDGPNCSFLHVPERPGKSAKNPSGW